MDLSPTVPTFFKISSGVYWAYSITIRLFLPLVCLYNLQLVWLCGFYGFYNWIICVVFTIALFVSFYYCAVSDFHHWTVCAVFTIGHFVWFLPFLCLYGFTIGPLVSFHHCTVSKFLPLDCLCGFTCTIGLSRRFLPLDLLKDFYHWIV